jgi:hypothetical protein
VAELYSYGTVVWIRGQAAHGFAGIAVRANMVAYFVIRYTPDNLTAEPDDIMGGGKQFIIRRNLVFQTLKIIPVPLRC